MEETVWTPTLPSQPSNRALRSSTQSDAADAASSLSVPFPSSRDVAAAVERTTRFPRLRYMGSKYRLVPYLAGLFDELDSRVVLDAFSGSGVVAYTLKALGCSVTTNDFLAFPAVIAQATIANQGTRLTVADVERITGAPADSRDFIQRKFDGLYFTAEDRMFLDAAWSHIDGMRGNKRALAISALVLAAARKQPRGVFTFTDLRYDDGRRDLRLPLREHFAETAEAYNAVVFDSGRPGRAMCGDVFDLDTAGYDLVYLDPPYAPPRDDNCYIKRYHFLEGLSVYWRGQTILEATRTKKLAKRYTPFSYKHAVVEALRETFKRFARSTIVLSYSSNAVPDAGTIEALMREAKGEVEVREIDHRYHFGTHAQAERRAATEYLFIGR
jgi:adenine-specific DNA-methyltransferase